MRDEPGAQPHTASLARLILPAILGLALGLRLAYVAGLPPDQAFRTVDARGYGRLALNLLETGRFTLVEATPSLLDAIRTPVYPAFLAPILAATGGTGRSVPLAHAVVDTGTVLLTYALACRLAGARRGRVAALLYAVNPVSFLLIGEALSEIVAAFILALALLCLVAGLQSRRPRPGLFALAGLAGGLCILCKPNLVLLPLLLALAIAVQSGVSWRTARRVGALGGASLLVLLPWLAHNRAAFGEWFLSLTPEANLAHISAVATVAEARGESVAPWTARWEEIYMSDVLIPARQRYGWDERSGQLTTGEAIQQRHDAAAVARELIKSDVRAFVAAHGKGVLRSFIPALHRYWYPYFFGTTWPEAPALSATLAEANRQRHAAGWPAALEVLRAWWIPQPIVARGLWLAAFCVQVAGYLLVAAGLWALRSRPGPALALALTLAYLLALPGPIAYVRFWVPAMPLACAAMACAFWRKPAAEQAGELNESAEHRGEG